MGGEYKKYVPVKPEEEARRLQEKSKEYQNFFKMNMAFESLFKKVRAMAPLSKEERKAAFEKFRKSHYDHQPLISAETTEKFFKDILPEFKVIKDPEEMKKRQEIHDAGWDVFETYANEYVHKDFPYAYPKGSSRFVQSLFGALPTPEDREELYKLAQKKGDPLSGDPETKAAYEKLVVKSVDHMLAVADEIRDLTRLDDEQLVKEVAPYLGVIMHMCAADDSLKEGDAFKDCDPQKIEQIKQLNTIGVAVLAKMQRILDMHYPAYSYKNAEDMSIAEIVDAKNIIDFQLENMTINGISGYTAGLCEFNGLALSVDLARTQKISDASALLGKALGCNPIELSSTYHYVDMNGNVLMNELDAVTALDRGEIVYAQTKIDYEKGVEDSKVIPLYCGGSILQSTIYTGDNALTRPQRFHKYDVVEAEAELKAYEDAHPEPKMSRWDKFVAGLVNAVTFGTRFSAAEIEYDRAHAEWENNRNKAKADLEKIREMHKIFMNPEISEKAKAKLDELAAESAEQYKKDKVSDIEKRKDQAIQAFVKGTFDVEKDLDDLKTAVNPNDPNPVETARCLARIIGAKKLQWRAEELKNSEDFYLELGDLQESYNLKDEMRSLMNDPDFIRFRRHYDYELDGATQDKIKDAYYDSIELFEKIDTLSADKRTPAEQKADREALIRSALREDLIINKLQDAYKKGDGAEVAKYAARLILTSEAHKKLAENIDKPEFCNQFKKIYDSEEFVAQLDSAALEELMSSAAFNKFFGEYDFSAIGSIKDMNVAAKLAEDYQKLGVEGVRKDAADKFIKDLDLSTPAKKLQALSLTHNPEKLKDAKDYAAEIIVKANIKNKLEAAVAGGSSEADFKAVIESFDLQQQLRTLKESPEFGEFIGNVNFSDPKTVKILSDPDKMLESFIMGSGPAPAQSVQAPVNTNEKNGPAQAQPVNGAPIV